MKKENIFYLNHESHYGDGQHYFNCDYCGEQCCYRSETETECNCRAKIIVIDDYE